MTSLRGKNEVEVNSSAVVLVVLLFRVLIAEQLNYFITLLRGQNEVEVKIESNMHNYNVTLVH